MTAKKGEAYVNSPEKRRLDVLAATSLLPLEMAFRGLALTQLPPGISLILVQERMGANGQVFVVRKIRTLKDDGTPISSLMNVFRMNGIDELPQVRNILAGDMSLVGRRPLIPSEFDKQYETVGADREGAKLVDYHRRTAGRAKPGILSTHAIQGHRGDETVMTFASRLELDIYDFEQASAEHSLKLMKLAFRSVTRAEMHSGNIQLSEAGIPQAE
jgi:lipopolysaccharide/colanic/teichoic acid biosynthesis glycosyltransferase